MKCKNVKNVQQDHHQLDGKCFYNIQLIIHD